MSETPWYVSFFGEDYLRIYTPFLPAERSAQDVEGIVQLLNLAPENNILDLCCGYGRHAIPLAQRGFAVTGLDISESLLQRARSEAQAQGASVRWIQSDMRTLPFESEFDAVINIFTSFGYLENEDEDLKVLRQVQRALKPGGLFLLETVYQPRVVRSFSPHGIIRYPNGLIVLEERQINLLNSRNEIRISLLSPDGRRTEHKQSMRIYTLTELTRMLTSIDFTLQAYYGGLDGSALTMDSRLVIVCKKMTI